MRIGIVGTGGMGNVHARHYGRMPDVELVAFDTDGARLADHAERTGATPAASLEDLIDRADAVDVCLPTDLHAPVALQAIAAGRCVFVEKPLAGTLEDARRLVQAAEARGVVLVPGQVVRFFPDFARVHRLVREGAVGRPASARTRRGGAAPQGSGGWFQDFERSGGVLLDLAVHDFDWLRWTLGEVTRVFSRSVRFGRTVAGAEFVGDYALTTLTHESGCVSHCETTWMDPGGFRTTVEVSGSEGTVEVDSRANPALRTAVPGGPVRNESPLAPDDDPYYLQLRAFVDAVAGTSPPVVDAVDGFRATAIALAALESARTGRTVVPARG